MSNKQLEKSYIPFQCMIVNSLSQKHIEEVGTAQYYILELLNNQGKKTAKELSEDRGITQSAISKLAKKLLDKGYITQERSQTDRRSYDVSITGEGREFLNQAEKFRIDILDIIENALDETEIGQFSKLCVKITGSIQ
ncbi:MAG: MarR family winged helix-turn-helix transcriptional regulator [Lachnospiraceae bacterium]